MPRKAGRKGGDDEGSPPGGGGFAFASIQQAFTAEALLLREGLPVRLVLAPRRLQTDCGYALRFPWEERERALALLAREGIEVVWTHLLPD
jgi:hypothetical protein